MWLKHLFFLDLARSECGIIIVQIIAHPLWGLSSNVLVRMMFITSATLKPTFFANGKEDWFPVKHFIVYFTKCFYLSFLRIFLKFAWFRGCLNWGCWVLFTCFVRVNFCMFTAVFANEIWMVIVFSRQAAAFDRHICTATVGANSASPEVYRTIIWMSLSILHCQREVVHRV